MALVQDDRLACRALALDNLKHIAMTPSTGRDVHSKGEIRTQDQPQARQSLAETIRGVSNASTTGKTPFLVILTADQARMIYSLRSESTTQSFELRSVAGKSSLVAELYGVSPKTIRDVWNRKTWTQVWNFRGSPCWLYSHVHADVLFADDNVFYVDSGHATHVDSRGSRTLRAGAHAGRSGVLECSFDSADSD